MFAKWVGLPVCRYSIPTRLANTILHLYTLHKHTRTTTQTPLIILHNMLNPMHTSTTKLSHGQTHSTHPAPLCSDQSHLKGFPLPMNGPTLGLVVYLLLDAFFFQVCQTPTLRSSHWEWRKFPSSLSCRQSDSQWPWTKGLQRGSIDCSWGLKLSKRWAISVPGQFSHI